MARVEFNERKEKPKPIEKRPANETTEEGCTRRVVLYKLRERQMNQMNLDDMDVKW